ncbi:bifunctional helix-turn-helix transcriptional regulator/GNAT family N-acetyltransferase [Longimicrobium sp.]|uniref:bifunctional helix-turn-helix transcriptional regulator/GNAT family N-acetyltransferase n=1 Tax=Longimicrobium sp. TaxID=2029185 RepID=UPI002C448BDF|nr:bifunctional helix-turn-helix transcriptional regulator/GNAT family N-acetyltransferase [Longimicrobium sp.]HSU15330.1 bifunctional helix-turn-helix transcriptional regulator/GNAT family N-acetyltransferase [Longimicrobium sp.]
MAMDPAEMEAQIAAMRRFNRFYTRRVGALGEGHLQTQYTLTEVRVMYEVAHQDRITASELGERLALDAGYLSRILTRFQERGLVSRTPSEKDARQAHLSLTGAGREEFARLNAAAEGEIAEMLRPLAEDDRRSLVGALQRVERLLGGRADAPITLREHRPGDMGWIVHRHGVLYWREYGWDERFEALVARVAAGFIDEFQPGRERAWIAEREGEIVGSVFCTRMSEDVAKLRLLLVEPSARGVGLGHRLVDECIRFAREAGYRKLVLWTNSVLLVARRIYARAGFRMVQEEENDHWGLPLIAETWELEL